MNKNYELVTVTAQTLDVVIQFLLPYEPKCVSLMSRLLKQRQEFNQKSQKIWCIVQKREPILVENIQGVVLITNMGVVLHHIINCPGQLFMPLLKNINLFSIAGNTRGTNQFLYSLQNKPAHIFDYHLMISNIPLQLEKLLPENFEIIKCQPSDEKRLFSLQKNYQIEEVLPPGKALSDNACLQIVRNRISEYTVYAIQDKNTKNLVAMAGTNGLSKNYAQIGGVYTDVSFRNKGFAQILIHHLISHINKTAVLFVRKENIAAITAYKKNNFFTIDSYTICYI